MVPTPKESKRRKSSKQKIADSIRDLQTLGLNTSASDVTEYASMFIHPPAGLGRPCNDDYLKISRRGIPPLRREALTRINLDSRKSPVWLIASGYNERLFHLNEVIVQNDRDGHLSNLMTELAELIASGEGGALDNAVCSAKAKKYWEAYDNFKHNPVNELQLAVMKSYADIEKRFYDYAWLSPSQAMSILKPQSKNPSRDLKAMISAQSIMAFKFNGTKLMVPLFQFEERPPSISPVVPRVLEYLGDFDDWSLFNWLSSFQEDIGSTPIDAIRSPELHDSIVDSAMFYYASQVEYDE